MEKNFKENYTGSRDPGLFKNMFFSLNPLRNHYETIISGIFLFSTFLEQESISLNLSSIRSTNKHDSIELFDFERAYWKNGLAPLPEGVAIEKKHRFDYPHFADFHESSNENDCLTDKTFVASLVMRRKSWLLCFAHIVRWWTWCHQSKYKPWRFESRQWVNVSFFIRSFLYFWAFLDQENQYGLASKP